ncbi:MAG: uracil-DNA glycosylase [Acidobacteria bacterium]|nr:uracil-DNA glycosylase [Acidobacteriota bacterium]
MSERHLADLPRCDLCELSRTRTRVVLGTGPRDARLLVVGEAPGREEDLGGRPFVGRSGQLLRRLIAEEWGLGEDDYLITNAVKCRPPNNRTPRPRELAACRPWLDLERATWRPERVLAVGNVAARAVFGFRDGVGTVHGQLVTFEGGAGLATYHPAAALRGGPNVVAVMREDLRVLARWNP